MYQALLTRFTKICKDILQDDLVGVYLHGSAAMGCFDPQKSDLDLIVIVDRSPSDAEKLDFMEQIVSLHEAAPPKGLELSLVKREFCSPFVYPTPFELHFSNTHLNWFRSAPRDYIEKMRGTDPDLAAHFTIIRRYGIVLYGAEIDTVFAPVPRADYVKSIWLDIQNAREDMAEDPVYFTLNLCRVLSYLQDDLILSKIEAGQWAVKSLPAAYCGFVASVLACRGSDGELPVDLTLARDFADHMLSKILPYVENCNL